MATDDRAQAGEQRPAKQAGDEKPPMLTVVLTRDKALLDRYGGAQTRFEVGQDTTIELPPEAKQRAGFELPITLARKLVQVCPLYKLKSE